MEVTTSMTRVIPTSGHPANPGPRQSRLMRKPHFTREFSLLFPLLYYRNEVDGLLLLLQYDAALKASGRAVAFTAITLAICVGSWAFSPIKFQADMGVLLAFMFLWNMLGALLLLPALAWLIGGRRKAVGRWLSVQA